VLTPSAPWQLEHSLAKRCAAGSAASMGVSAGSSKSIASHRIVTCRRS
jgi:hypothetical protein